MAAIARELGLAQTLSISKVVVKLQEIHKSEEKLTLPAETTDASTDAEPTESAS